MKKFLSFLCTFSIAFSILTGSWTPKVYAGNGEAITRQLDIVTDMVHNNPGQIPYVSAYNDPSFLEGRGLSGKVFFLYDAAQFGIDWQEYDPNIFPVGSESYNWVQTKKASLHNKYNAAKDAGQKVYFMMDMIVFPSSVRTLYGSEILNGNSIDINKPKTQELIKEMFREMFEEFPEIDGIYVRHGETYVGSGYGTYPDNSAPYYFGNNPILKNPGDHVTLINILRKELCEDRDKDLIYRTWCFYDFQKTKNGYLQVANQIEPHDNLYFAIKYTSGDFWRTYPFNQSLNAGAHKQIVEVQCAREYEGKGAFPNYIGNGVINGFEEYEWLMGEDENKSLRDIINVEDSNVVGVWTWSRGGGWGGPYINGNEVPAGNELWTDLNSYVMQTWAQDTSKTDEELVLKYAKDVLGMDNQDAAAFYSLCIKSARAVLLGIATNEAPTIDVLWTRDDTVNFDKFNDNLKIIYKTKKDGKYTKLEESREAVRLWEEMLEITESFDDDVPLKQYMITTTQYGLYMFSLFERMITAGILHTEMQESETNILPEIQQTVKDYDELWANWLKLKADNPDCPTLYKQADFNRVMNQYRYQLSAPQYISLEAGETYRISASVSPYTTGDLVYTSTDPEIAAVNSSGLVTAVKNGFTRITVETSDRKLRTAVMVAVCDGTKAEELYKEDFETGYTRDETLNLETATWDSNPQSPNSNSFVCVTENVTGDSAKGDNVLKLTHNGAPTILHKIETFDPALSDSFTLEFDMMTASKSSAFFSVYGTNGGIPVMQLDFRSGSDGIRANQDNMPVLAESYNANEWYHISVVFNIPAKTYSVSIYDKNGDFVSVNGVPTVVSFRNTESSDVGFFKVGVQNGMTNTVYYDNIVVSALVNNTDVSAEDVASAINKPETIRDDDKWLHMPAVPEGFEISIKSSSTNAVELDGTLNKTAEKQSAELVFTVTKTGDGTTADTIPVIYTVPDERISVPSVFLRSAINNIYNESVKAKLNVPEEIDKNGAFIEELVNGCYLKSLGMRQDDIIIELNGVTVTDVVKLQELYDAVPDNGSITLKTWRKNKYIEYTFEKAASNGYISMPCVVQAEKFDQKSGDVVIEDCSDIGGGENIGGISNGDWVLYENINFTEIPKYAVFRASKGSGTAKVEMRLDSPEGTVITSADIIATGGWNSYFRFKSDITGTITPGVHDVYLCFDGDMKLNWFSLNGGNDKPTDDQTYEVARFSSFETSITRQGGSQGQTLYADWKRLDGGTPVDLTKHDPGKLYLRLNVNFSASDTDVDLSGAFNGGNIKLRSVDAKKDNDPNGINNNEHNFGWDINSSWNLHIGDNFIDIPLEDAINGIYKRDASAQPNVKYGVNNKRGIMDWTQVQTIFMNVTPIEKAEYAGITFTMTIFDVKIVDITLEEELEKYTSVVSETISRGNYTGESYGAYTEALNAAKAELEAVGSVEYLYDNMDIIENAMQDLQTAIDNLEEIDIPVIQLGDVNFDEDINIFDIMMIRDHIFGKNTLTDEYYTAADVNTDGNINIFDIMMIRDYIFGKVHKPS